MQTIEERKNNRIPRNQRRKIPKTPAILSQLKKNWKKQPKAPPNPNATQFEELPHREVRVNSIKRKNMQQNERQETKMGSVPSHRGGNSVGKQGAQSCREKLSNFKGGPSKEDRQ